MPQMTEEKFDEIISELTQWNNRLILSVFHDTLNDPAARISRMQKLKEAGERFGITGEKWDKLYNEAIEQVKDWGEAQLDQGFAPFAPFAPPDLTQLPTFPVNSLPNSLEKFVQSIAEGLQVSADMPAVAMLGIIAISVQRKFVVEVKPDWRETLSLYVMSIARSSERKTPVLQLVTKPLYQYQKEENKRRRPDIERYRARRDLLQKSIQVMKDKAVKKGVCEETLREIEEKQAELNNLKAVHPLRLIADDVTPEKLASLMADNDEKISIVSSEGGIVDIMMGRYSSGLNVDIFLKPFTGEPVQVDRQGRDSISLDNPALSILLMVQPVILEGLAGNRELNNRGLVARVLYSCPASMIGKGRKFYTTPIPKEIEQAYSDAIYSMLKIPTPEEPEVIYLSEDATKLISDFFYEVEDKLEDELEGLDSWGGKCVGQAARIAALLHCYINQEDSAAELITGGTMQAAITIMQYFIEHTEAVLELIGEYEDPDEKLAKYILKRFNSTKEIGITKKKLFDLCRKKEGLKTVEEFDAILDILISHGYLAVKEVSTGGRPSEKVILSFSYLAQKAQKARKSNIAQQFKS